MQELWSDVRYAGRTLLANPGFAFVAIATLTLGIGANTALFSVINGVLLRPLPFRQPQALVTLYENRAHFRNASISYPNFLDWKRENHCFEAIAAFRPDAFTVTALGEPERAKGMMISAGLFPMLGVKLLVGRDLDPLQDHVGGRPEVLISEALWRRKFGASQDVLNRAIRLNGVDYTVVGVIPATFRLALFNFQPGDLYVPIGQWTDPLFHRRNVGMGMDAIARLKPRVSLEEARGNMSSVASSLAQIFPDDDSKVGVTIIPLKDDMVGDVRPYLLVLIAAVFFVLLIACFNVANLLLVRSTVRVREFAIRLALGARKSRIMGQLLTESVLLSFCGGSLGLILAAWVTPLALKCFPDRFPRSTEIQMDTRVLLFTFVVSVIAGVLFGLAPAIKTLQSDLQSTLKEGARGSRGGKSRTQSIFASIEIAMALVLLIGAVLMIRSLARLWSTDPGFRPSNVMVFQVGLPPAMSKAPPDAIRAELRRIHGEIASVPGVLSISLQRGGLPMFGDSDDPIWIGGRPKPQRESDMAWSLWYEVEPDYFKVMQIPLHGGRLFNIQDRENSALVAVVDQSFAQKYFPHENPIGRTFTDEFLARPARIIGIAGHVKQWGLDDKLDLHAEFYIPFDQIPDDLIVRAADSTGVLVRSAGPPLALFEPIKQEIEKANSEEVAFDPHSYDEIVSNSLAARSFAMTMLGAFAALALVLASIGIYGVVSYVVGQRTHEIGVRMALGAHRRNVLSLVLKEGAQISLIGIGAGIFAALGLTQLMSSVLYGVSATDPLTFIAVTLFLVCIALLACYIPAVRAIRVNPIIALRYE